MNRLDLCPLQESYAVQFGCSVQRDVLPGGFSRYTTVTPSKKHLVSISYNLTEPDYHYFRAFYLNWQLNPLPFLMKLYIEDSEFKDYICQFVPDSSSLDALSGKIFSVSAQLVVVISPVVILTSKTYPTIFDECIRSTASIIDVAQRTIMNNAELETENLSSSASLLEVSWRDVMNSAKIEIESTVTLASITEVVRRSIMNSTSTTTESVGASALITGVTRRVALLTNTTSIDSMMASASIVSAQITN